jgi:hypothetical protein
VHSFTSSSSDRLPALPYRKIWLLSVTLSVLLLGGWEGFWRLKGYHRTPPPQDPRDWAVLRRAASRGGDQAVVLIGTSRMILDFDTDIFIEATGRRPVQLAIEGKSPLAVLANLADDHNFKGLVICDFHEVFVYATEGTKNPRMNLSAQDFVKAYTDRSFLTNLLPARVDEYSHKFFTQTFVFQMPELSPANVIHYLVRGQLPPKPQDSGTVTQEGITFSLRGHQLTNDEIEKLRQHFQELTETCIKSTTTSASLREDVAGYVDGLVRRIQSRGGKVVFVCFPMGGKIWEINERSYPKKDYWDFLASHASGTWIHFTDYPTLSGYNLPDWSHLDHDGRLKFTKALTDILIKGTPSERKSI